MGFPATYVKYFPLWQALHPCFDIYTPPDMLYASLWNATNTFIPPWLHIILLMRLILLLGCHIYLWQAIYPNLTSHKHLLISYTPLFMCHILLHNDTCNPHNEVYTAPDVPYILSDKPYTLLMWCLPLHENICTSLWGMYCSWLNLYQPLTSHTPLLLCCMPIPEDT